MASRDQYLSHRDEAGPMLKKIARHFGSTLHAPVAELVDIGKHAHVDVPVGSRHTDQNGVEIIPTPGHSPGSTCYLVPGAEGSYLFTGDTLIRSDEGNGGRATSRVPPAATPTRWPTACPYSPTSLRTS